MKLYELIFYQDDNKWRHNLIPIEVSKNDSARVVDINLQKSLCAH